MGLDQCSNWGKISHRLPTFRASDSFSLCLTYKITKDFAGILACRVFIGLPEAAFYPGSIFLLSRWYTKKVILYILPFFLTNVCNSQELAFRSAFLYAGSLTSNAFGSVSGSFR